MKFRIIPILLYKSSSIVKTINYESHRRVGDVPSTLRVFSRRQADELILIDLDACNIGEINKNLIFSAVQNSNMPLTMGGRLQSLASCTDLIRQGCDKLVFNTLYFDNKPILKKITKELGSQAVVLSIDYTVSQGEVIVKSNNGSKVQSKNNLDEIVKEAEDLGVGEIILSNITQEGTLNGFDLKNIAHLPKLTKVPLLVSGGCKGTDDIIAAYKLGFSGACMSSIFFWQGDSIISIKKDLIKNGVNVRVPL